MEVKIHKLGIIIGLFLAIEQLLGFQPEEIIREIESIRDAKKEEKLITGLKGLFDDEGDIWLSWNEHDRKPEDWRETIFTPRQYYTYWYAQKFSSKGESYFPAVELAKRKIGYGVSAPIFLGNLGDVYTFPGSSFRIERVDNKSNHYTSSKNYSYYAGNMFIDPSGIMYVFSSVSSLQKCTKFRVQEPMPIFMDEQDLPGWNNPDGYKYRWIGSNLKFCNSLGNFMLFLRPPSKKVPCVDTTKINIYRVSLPDLMSVDTSSFRVSDALHKKVRGCKLRTKVLTSRGLETKVINVSALVEGNGDTLLMYLSSRDAKEDLIYVCKLTKNGEPIKSKEIIEEEVEDFDKAPEKLHKEIIFRGSVIGNLDQPTGIMIYGFDKSGNVYYYVWDKSDDYWKKK